MSTAAPTRLITAEQFAEIHFEEPVELVRGVFVELTRSDRSHGSVCVRGARALKQWAFRVDSSPVRYRCQATLTSRELSEFSIPVNELFSRVE